jgi:hypothetical protein
VATTVKNPAEIRMSVVAEEVDISGIISNTHSISFSEHLLISFSNPDAVPRSLATVFAKIEEQNADDRPNKRRKIAKSGPNSLSEKNGVSMAGIPVGYIPLARLTLRMVSPPYIGTPTQAKD